MKERTIVQNVYETGDILDVTKVIIDLKNRKNISGAQKGIVLAVNELKSGVIKYKILCNTGDIVSLSSQEQGNEKYIGHIKEFDNFFDIREVREEYREEYNKSASSKADWNDIAKDYNDGMTPEELSEKYNIELYKMQSMCVYIDGEKEKNEKHN
jgi:small nuclear ribonucleoprotein (snRNP)-like protein